MPPNQREAKIPNTIDRAFNGCSGLTSVKIPNGVTTIGRRAFAECIGLTSLIIPSSVTSIFDYAFLHCSNLKEVHFEDPNGWEVSKHSDMRNAISVSSLNDPATAADYLTHLSYYVDYYWKRG